MTEIKRDARGRKLGYTALVLPQQDGDMRNAVIADSAGNIAIICDEGVFNAADENGMVHIYTWNGVRVVNVNIDLVDVVDGVTKFRHTSNPVELAEFIRVFGSRLDSNHHGAASWIDRDNTGEIYGLESEVIYSVYTLTYGIVEDVYGGNSYDDAHTLYEAAIGAEMIRKSRVSNYAETTVHLYDEVSGNMVSEYCVTKS